MMFVHYNGKLINADTIRWIDYSNLAKKGYIRVCNKVNEIFFVEGSKAFDVVMRLCPEALEGEQAQYKRHAWAVHNLFGHPLMQICSWLGLAPLGLKIHDITVPNPITK
jgi:hypothetical protein